MITDEQVKAAIFAYHDEHHYHPQIMSDMRKAIEAYEQSKPKPVAGCRIDNGKVVAVDWDGVNDNCPAPLYTTPPTREPLSDCELREILNNLNEGDRSIYDFARAIEQAHGIGSENE